MKYILVEELESEKKIFENISVQDLFFCIGYFVVFLAFSDFVHPKLQLLYYGYNILVSLFLTIPSRSNPKRRMYQTIFFILIKNKNVYKPVASQEKGESKSAL